MNTDLMFSSETDQWATPQDFFNKVNNVFHFTLDVCADSNNHKCQYYFDQSLGFDGLKMNWTGVCWMNPPYGRDIGAWVKKAYESAKGGGYGCLLASCKDRYQVVARILCKRGSHAD